MTEQKRFDNGKLFEDSDGVLTFEVLNDGNASYYDEDGITELLNELNEEKEELKGSLYAEKTNTSEVINEYSKQFKRHSKEFSFMIDLAEDLGVDVRKLEALDDWTGTIWN